MSSCSFLILRGTAAILAALALCAPLAGCSTPLDRAWGVSYHAHVAQSVAHPDAGMQASAGPRVDGMSTDAALSKHRSRETTVEEKNTETIINIGK
jgi:hypothetical protein